MAGPEPNMVQGRQVLPMYPFSPSLNEGATFIFLELLCPLLYAFKWTNITLWYLLAQRLPEMDEKGMVFIK